MQKEKKRENVYKIIANDDTLHSISEFNNGSHPVTQDPIEGGAVPKSSSMYFDNTVNSIEPPAALGSFDLNSE